MKQLLKLVLFSLLLCACKHEIATNTPADPDNNGGNNGGNGGNSGGNNSGTGIVCSPDSVYFQNQVLPILVSNCAKSGCHDAASAQDGVRLYSYDTYRSSIDHSNSADPKRNEMLEVLFESDPDKKMPPPPNTPLSTDQLNLLKTWLAQGAVNNGCNENYNGCSTDNVSWSAFVQPLINSKCKGCHTGASAGAGIQLTSYPEVKTVALSGKLHEVITRPANWMPKGGARLDDCTAQKVKSWVNAGAPQN